MRHFMETVQRQLDAGMQVRRRRRRVPVCVWLGSRAFALRDIGYARWPGSGPAEVSTQMQIQQTRTAAAGGGGTTGSRGRRRVPAARAGRTSCQTGRPVASALA